MSRSCLTLALTALVLAPVWLAPTSEAGEAPVVHLVSFAQRSDGSGLLDIYYDLSDGDSDTLAVGVQASDNEGLSWNSPCNTLSGDVGQGVTPGEARHIVWDFAYDNPGIVDDGYTVRVVASDVGVEHTTHSPEKYWIMDWRELDWTQTETVEKFAKADVVCLSSFFLWGNNEGDELEVVSQLKALNPDIVILAYTLAKTNMLWWGDQDELAFARQMYDRTLPFWSYTTEGDTLMDWTNQVVLNLLEPECRDIIATTIAEFQQPSPERCDGVFWDYFNNKIWISPAIRDQVHGEPDLDRDGIPMAEDADERAAYQAACSDLVVAVREAMGEDYIQVFNGQRAYGDSVFAALSDGVYYELFPTLFFDSPKMRSAMDMENPFSLWNSRRWPRTQNGGPYIVLGNIWRNFYVDYENRNTLLDLGDSYRAVALLLDTYSAWLSHGSHTYGWPEVEINLGPPLGPPQINGDVFTREFRYGNIELQMDSGQYPDPFDYWIYVNGNLVQAFDRPYHHP